MNQDGAASKKKQNVWMIVSLVLGLILLAGASLFVFGYASLSDNDGQSSMPVCGTDIVNRFNEAYRYTERVEGEGLSYDHKGLQSISDDIKKMDGAENDATCQTMNFWIAYVNRDQAKANAVYKKLYDMHEQGKFPDSNMISPLPLYMYESTVSSLTEPENVINVGRGE
ncbi:hypothetical protein EOL96_07155 [Candidatus Saccharibacteria bacterium]|nr:hypothetical protein [Candidatus Saccharibacteria bacterium]